MSASVIGANEFEHSEGFKVYLSVIGKNKFDPAAAQFYFRKQRLRHYTRDDHRENNDGDISAEIRFDILFCEPSLFMPSVQDGARSGDDKKRKHLYAKNDYIFHLSSRLNNFYREVKTSDMKGFLEKYDYRLRFPQIENDIKTDVLVVGGGMVGCETAAFLGEQEHDVTVIEFRDTVGADVIHEHRVYLMKDFEDYGIKEITGAKVCKFYEDGVEYETADGVRHETRGYDSVILSMGFRNYNPLEEKIKDLVPETHVIGDAIRARRALDATKEAYAVASKL